jgi:hypothetical protein
VHKQFVRNQLPWADVPGYQIIVKAILLEMKARAVKEYPDALVNASAALLLNTAIMPTFITILFSKTNIYDFETVQAAYKILDTWFQCIHSHGKALAPTAIDRRFFVEGLRVSILSEI